VARQGRSTTPLHSKLGLLETYEQQNPPLAEAEWRGRAWAFEQARQSQPLKDFTITDMHRAMFEPLLDWAGSTRTEDCGPGAKLFVPWWGVRIALRNFQDDFALWLTQVGSNPSLEQIVGVVADAHHRFQWIHPFRDTNGRTGRVLDHFVLWSCFGLADTSLERSVIVEHFPDASREHEYYEGLDEADLRKPKRLQAYYAERIQAALDEKDPETQGH